MKKIPIVSGAKSDTGHIEEYSANFVEFLLRAEAECGPLAEYNLAGQETILLSGVKAQEFFFRGSDENLSRAAAYQAMVPVFGPGVIFDAPPDKMKSQLKIQVDALRYQKMKNYAPVIAQEVEDWIADWGDEGELDFMDEFLELTIHTATHCLLGKDFRDKMTAEFKTLYRDLEAGLQAIAFVDPYMQQPIFEQRDRARERLEEIITAMIDERRNSDIEYNDALATFMTGTYADGSCLTSTEVTGLVIATIFAGHHTSSGTSTWMLTELARHPKEAAGIVEELNAIYQQDETLSHNALREMPKMESFLNEVLRVHPPLVVLMRRVINDIEFDGHAIPAGKTVAISIFGSHRNAEYFPDPEKFDPSRTEPETMFAYIPFGGGRHKCGGNAFALLQQKAIFSALLRRYSFEIIDHSDSYVDDLSGMVLRPQSPCRLRYKRRVS